MRIHGSPSAAPLQAFRRCEDRDTRRPKTMAADPGQYLYSVRTALDYTVGEYDNDSFFLGHNLRVTFFLFRNATFKNEQA